MGERPLGLQQVAVGLQSGERRLAREHLDEHVAEAGQVGTGGVFPALEHLGSRIRRGAGAVGGYVVERERRTHVDDLRVARPLHHDVGAFDVAVHDLLPVQGGQGCQAFADDRDRHAGLEP